MAIPEIKRRGKLDCTREATLSILHIKNRNKVNRTDTPTKPVSSAMAAGALTELMGGSPEQV